MDAQNENAVWDVGLLTSPSRPIGHHVSTPGPLPSSWLLELQPCSCASGWIRDADVVGTVKDTGLRPSQSARDARSRRGLLRQSKPGQKSAELVRTFQNMTSSDDLVSFAAFLSMASSSSDGTVSPAFQPPAAGSCKSTCWATAAVASSRLIYLI